MDYSIRVASVMMKTSTVTVKEPVLLAHESGLKWRNTKRNTSGNQSQNSDADFPRKPIFFLCQPPRLQW